MKILSVLLVLFSATGFADTYYKDKINENVEGYAKEVADDYVERLSRFSIGAKTLIYKSLYESMGEDKISWSAVNYLGLRDSYFKQDGNTQCYATYEKQTKRNPFSFFCESPEFKTSARGDLIVTNKTAEMFLENVSKMDQQILFNVTMARLLTENQIKALFDKANFEKLEVKVMQHESYSRSLVFTAYQTNTKYPRLWTFPIVICEKGKFLSSKMGAGEFFDLDKAQPKLAYDLSCEVPSTLEIKYQLDQFVRNLKLPQN